MIIQPLFLNAQECLDVCTYIDDKIVDSNHHVWLADADNETQHFLELLKDKLAFLLDFVPVGNKVTLGRYNVGQYLHKHVDGSYQGGTHSLLIYLNTPEGGGETMFDDGTCISPVQGTMIIFGIHELHEALVVTKGHKYILGCEVTIGLLAVA